MNPADKRLVVMVPDHLVDDIDLQGIIPWGSYGAWPVVVWDSITSKAVEPGDPMGQIKRGNFAFILHGKKLRGTFALTCLARREIGMVRSSRRYPSSTSILAMMRSRSNMGNLL
jgi:bifunctional non-homologous end joining protein LigD